MSDAGSLSIGLAFVAGLVSFLSPCVLPLVPSYVTFVTGMTLDELTAHGRSAARRRAALHALLFVLGFSLVFVALGATATALGDALRPCAVSSSSVIPVTKVT
jgi:cytochrome c-type biogenesis protein